MGRCRRENLVFTGKTGPSIMKLLPALPFLPICLILFIVRHTAVTQRAWRFANIGGTTKRRRLLIISVHLYNKKSPEQYKAPGIFFLHFICKVFPTLRPIRRAIHCRFLILYCGSPPARTFCPVSWRIWRARFPAHPSPPHSPRLFQGSTQIL